MMTRQRAARNLLLFLFILAASIIAAITSQGCSSTAGATGGGLSGYTGDVTIGTKPGETNGDVYVRVVYVRVVVRDSTGAELVVYYPMHLFKSSAVPVDATTGP